MKKQFFCITALLITVFASTSMAATASFWAVGGNDAADAPAPNPILPTGTSRSFLINYTLGNDWIINSASLWLKAADDFNSRDNCSTQSSLNPCNDDNNQLTTQDSSERALVTRIENDIISSGNAQEINAYGWYELNINVTSYLSNMDGQFRATINALGGDFYYKNAKIVVDYETPVPAAIWLFGSALIGLFGVKQKSA